MTTTKIPVIYGSRSSKFISKQNDWKKQNLLPFNRKSLHMTRGFVRYHYDFNDIASLNGLGNDLNHARTTKDYVNVSNNFTDFYCHRDHGFLKNHQTVVQNEYGLEVMVKNGLFKENVLDLGDINKVFCSLWLSDDQIVIGTKCNQLLVYDVNSKKVDLIPSLTCPSFATENHSIEQCGIHALKLNPSKTYLATGAQCSNDVAVYRSPSLHPVCIGSGGHSDWVFDICWLDDFFFVTGSRDKTMALWRVEDNDFESSSSPNYSEIDLLEKKKCIGADKVRSLLYNPNYVEVVALSLNAKIHVWDISIFKQVMSQELELANENVCLTSDDSFSFYAVGSKGHVTLIDPRTLQSINKIETHKNGLNVRSLSFMGTLLTIGTGTGNISFYDVRAGRFLDGCIGSSSLTCSKCPASGDGTSANYSGMTDSAVYTHCYDWSGTRLFTAGGPLSSSFRGSYASIWC